MTRSGYQDDLDQWDLIRWRGAVESAMRGKRGQAFLREMLAALDALPEKALDASVIVQQGEKPGCCAMGAVAIARGIEADALKIDPEDPEAVGKLFNISRAMAQEIAFYNDEWGHETPEARWERMRRWVERKIIDDPIAPSPDGPRP